MRGACVLSLPPLTGGSIASPIPLIVQDANTVLCSQTPGAASL